MRPVSLLPFESPAYFSIHHAPSQTHNDFELQVPSLPKFLPPSDLPEDPASTRSRTSWKFLKVPANQTFEISLDASTPQDSSDKFSQIRYLDPG